MQPVTPCGDDGGGGRLCVDISIGFGGGGGVGIANLFILGECETTHARDKSDVFEFYNI